MPTTLSSAELETVYQFSVNLAKKAGALIIEGSQSIRNQLGSNHSSDSSSTVDSKKNSVDLVTEWDVRVEDLVRSEIEKEYPNFGLYVGPLHLGAGLVRFSVFFQVTILRAVLHIFKHRRRVLLKRDPA